MLRSHVCAYMQFADLKEEVIQEEISNRFIALLREMKIVNLLQRLFDSSLP